MEVRGHVTAAVCLFHLIDARDWTPILGPGCNHFCYSGFRFQVWPCLRKAAVLFVSYEGEGVGYVYVHLSATHTEGQRTSKASLIPVPSSQMTWTALKQYKTEQLLWKILWKTYHTL